MKETRAMQGGRLVLAFVSLLFAACTAEWYTRDADREVSGVLDEFTTPLEDLFGMGAE